MRRMVNNYVRKWNQSLSVFFRPIISCVHDTNFDEADLHFLSAQIPVLRPVRAVLVCQLPR